LKVKELIEVLEMFDKEKELKIKSCSGTEWNIIANKIDLVKQEKEKIITLWIK